MSSFTQESLAAKLKRKWRERKFTRAFERHRCNMDVTMLLAPRLSSLNGRLIDISRGGGMFRPCLSYLMERRGAEGFLVVANQKIAVHIVRTLPVGYALQFDTILSEEDFQLICEASHQEKQAA